MNTTKAVTIITDLAYEKNMGILETVQYMKNNIRSLSEEQQDAFFRFYYEAEQMFAPVHHEYQTYNEHSE
jgi:uncharacterized protein YjiK